MMNWTHFLAHGVSMLAQQYENRDAAPPIEPDTTILKLHCFPGQCSSIVSTSPEEPFGDISEATVEGKAMSAFLHWIGREPGHDFTMWSRVQEVGGDLIIFIGAKTI